MPPKPLKRRVQRFFVILVEIYVLLLIGLYLWQRHLIYVPERKPEAEMLTDAHLYNLEPWRDAQGILIGWRKPERAGSPPANRLLLFHGNAGSAIDRVLIMEAFERLGGGSLWDVYLFEYPGYGSRGGSISESEFRQAGEAALARLREKDQRPIFVAGESLGGGLACALAHDHPDAVSGVLLITPFSSMVDAAALHFPFIPARLLVRDRWNNMSALPAFHGPVAILVAENDTIVSARGGQKLFEVANQPKRLWLMPGIDHNDVDYSRDARWWSEASDFLLSARAAAIAGS